MAESEAMVERGVKRGGKKGSKQVHFEDDSPLSGREREKGEKEEKEEWGEEEFIPAERYSGHRKEYMFQTGPKGVGYYRDHVGIKIASEEKVRPNPPL